MKMAIFNGTPRKNGNTAEMVKLFAETAEKKGIDVSITMLDPLNFKGCRNCGFCRGKSEGKYCAVEDDMQPLYDIVKDCDVIAIASPIYMWGITAPAKAFMDRLHGMANEVRNDMKGKTMIMLHTLADEELIAACACNAVQLFCEFFKITYKGSYVVPFCDKEVIHEDYNVKRMELFIDRLLE